MNRNAEFESKRNEEVKQGLRNTADEAVRQLSAGPDPAALKEQTDRHTSEMATAKTNYHHHLAELTAQLGDVQAENTQILNDLGWFQENYQEQRPEDEEDGDEDHEENRDDQVDPAPSAVPPSGHLSATAPEFTPDQ